MEISLTEEFKRSWLTSIIGIALFFIGTWLLTWNEGRAVHHAHSLEEAYNNVIALNPYERVHSEFDERLVHISGPLSIGEPLTEPDYGVSIQSVRLKRRVQMYQWVEETYQKDFAETVVQHNVDDREYYYTTEWRDRLVDSSSFYMRHGHENPKGPTWEAKWVISGWLIIVVCLMGCLATRRFPHQTKLRQLPLKSHVHTSPLVKVGHLILGADLKEKFNAYVEVTSDERPERRDIKLHLGIYYHCDDVWNPKVGDIRIQFYYAGLSGEPVTIVAMQKDGLLLPYITSKGHEILLLREGVLSVAQMFNQERSDVYYETWKMRGIGTFVLFASFVCLSRLLRIFLLHFSSLRWLVRQQASSSTSFVVSVSVSLLVIATAWILYRPWLGAALIVAAISPFLYCTVGVLNIAEHQNIH